MRKTNARRARPRRLQALRSRLLARREELLREMEGELDSSRVRGNPVPMDSMEEASRNLDQETVFSLAEIGADEIGQIDVALKRMKAGSYGKCLVCGCRIPVRRLQVMPFATKCVRCKEKEERLGGRLTQQRVRSWERVCGLPQDMPDEQAFLDALREESNS